MVKNILKRVAPPVLLDIYRGMKHRVGMKKLLQHWKLPQKTSDECIVIGNAPSLNDNISEIIKYKADKYTLNDTCKYDIFFQIQPRAHFLIDPAYFACLSNLECLEKNWFNENVIKINEKFKELKNSCVLVVPLANVQDAHKYYSEVHTIYGCSTDKFSGNLVHAIDAVEYGRTGFGGGNCAIPAILTAILAGYKKIWIAGFDMSCYQFTIDKNCRIIRSTNHYYEDDAETSIYGFYNVANFYRGVASVFDDFDLLAELACYKGISIINISMSSLIQSFPKGKLGEEPYEWLAAGYKKLWK